MKLTIRRTADIHRTARVLQLCGLFDVPPTERSESAWDVDLPLDEAPWQIGLIFGPSGSGKTTLAREAFPGVPFVSINTGYDWPVDRAVVDGFPAALGIKEVTGALSSVGFSSPPSWLRPFGHLSTGEQFRATVARALCDPSPLVVVDEFTSVVDRTVAQIGSAAVAKAVRRTPGKKLVAVTCHFDVEEWLCPDWVVEMPSGTLTRRSLRRPPIELQIGRVDASAWHLFKHHHYLNKELRREAKCFAAFHRGQPVAFASSIYFPHGNGGWWQEHRTVCLPDFQGVGIGNALSETVAAAMKALKGVYRSTTGNPAMIRHRARSPLWQRTTKSVAIAPVKSTSKDYRKGFTNRAKTNRIAIGFKFVGPARPDLARLFGLL
jgi:ABC-type molybdenum transport system ATPase subunit/photorepair protein PhrA